MSAEAKPDIEISIVLITCDRAKPLRAAVSSLLAQKLDPGWSYELIVVDDGSVDDTPSVLQELRSDAAVPMHIVRTGGLGVPGARNLGARFATGRWMACFDDDQIASPGWLQGLRQTAEQTGSRCVGGALALRMPDTPVVTLGRRARALLGEHLPAERVTRYEGKWLPASNNALIDLKLFFAMGGFDELFVQGGSDTDLFQRMRAAATEIWFAPGARADHVLPSHRVGQKFLRWTALKVGAASARILLARTGAARCFAAIAMRCMIAVIRDLPGWCLAKMLRRRAAVLDARCSLWYTQGLLRGFVAGIAPDVLGGSRFLQAMNFRSHGGERIHRSGQTQPG